ncbi:multidrug and toxin extrusion protein 1-like [Glandiceps talaboti]
MPSFTVTYTAVRRRVFHCLMYKCMKTRVFDGIFVDEAKEIVKLMCPLLMVLCLNTGFGLISILYCGHIGKTELDASALAQSLMNVLGVSIGYGVLSACDTLFSQAYGSRNKKKVGLFLQRSIFVMLIFCVPCCAIFLNAELILLVLRQNPDIARLAGVYCQILCLCLPIQFMVILIVRYLQNQNIAYPIVISYAIGMVLHVIFNHLLVLKFGLRGAPWSQFATNCCVLAILILILKTTNLHRDTWPGWSTDCLYDWDEIIRLAIPSILMQCSEWWIYEIGYFLCGAISEDILATQAICFSISDLFYQPALSLSYAVGIRTGNYLGANQPMRAKQVSRVALVMNGTMCVIIASFGLSTKDILPSLYTSDVTVTRLTSTLVPLLMVVHFSDTASAVLSRVLTGCGRQRIGAVVNILAFYVIGLPISATLMFVANWGIFGYWAGILIASIFQVTVFLVVILWRDWQQEAYMAQQRAGMKTQTYKQLPAAEDDIDNDNNYTKRMDSTDTVTRGIDNNPLLQPDVRDENNLMTSRYNLNPSRPPLHAYPHHNYTLRPDELNTDPVPIPSLSGGGYVDVFTDCFTNKKLSESQRRGIITLLNKESDVDVSKPGNKDSHRKPENKRPPSLLNVDYKSLSKVLGNRLLCQFWSISIKLVV